MDLVENLESFRAVVRCGGFTHAARAEGLSQPVVSRRVAALEARLGVALLERSRHTVKLTDTGRRLLPLADELLSQWRGIQMMAADPQQRRFFVPSGLDPRALASIRRGLSGPKVTYIEDHAEARRRSWKAGRASLALLVVDSGPSTIDLPLGLAYADGEDVPWPLSRLRRLVRDRSLPARVLQVDTEDDVPAVRDTLTRLAHASGLRSDQVQVGTSHVEAHTQVHERGDVLLCTETESLRHGLAWYAPKELRLVRAYELVHPEDLTPSEVASVVAKLSQSLQGVR